MTKRTQRRQQTPINRITILSFSLIFLVGLLVVYSDEDECPGSANDEVEDLFST
jgi:hypothetical protein